MESINNQNSQLKTSKHRFLQETQKNAKKQQNTFSINQPIIFNMNIINEMLKSIIIINLINMNTNPKQQACQQNINPQVSIQSLQQIKLTHDQNYRCRICYQNYKPLYSICACSGSIQYIHEKCILKWIQKKLEASRILEMPSCQICQAKFYARMKIGKKRFSFKAFKERMQIVRWTEKFELVFNIFLVILCLATIVTGLNTTYTKIQGHSEQTRSPQQPLWSQILPLVWTNIILPLYLTKHGIQKIKKKQIWLKESMLQIVEISLEPRSIIMY